LSSSRRENDKNEIVRQSSPERQNIPQEKLERLHSNSKPSAKPPKDSSTDEHHSRFQLKHVTNSNRGHRQYSNERVREPTKDSTAEQQPNSKTEVETFNDHKRVKEEQELFSKIVDRDLE